MPQLRNFAADAEGAFGGITLLPLVGNEINVRLAGDAMDVSQTCAVGQAFEFKIRLQVLCRKNVGQRFAPDDAAFAAGIFQNLAAVALAPKFVGDFFYLRVAIRLSTACSRI